MRHPITILAFTLAACGGGSAPAEAPAGGPSTAETAAAEPTPAAETAPGGAAGAAPASADEPSAAPGSEAGGPREFTTLDTRTAKDTRGAKESKLSPTKSEALLKFVVVDQSKGPIVGIVISLTGPDGKKYYTEETDAVGYAEVLVPIAQKYEVVYVSLGRKDISANVEVEDKPNQTVKLTLRYKRMDPAKTAKAEPERFVLDGVNFDTNKATIRAESFARLDRVVEYMTHKKASRIEISGHTDNVGKKEVNKALSEKRANACRDYLISKGIDGARITAIGHGDERPVAPNDSEAGRQKNRRIEATEL